MNVLWFFSHELSYISPGGDSGGCLLGGRDGVESGNEQQGGGVNSGGGGAGEDICGGGPGDGDTGGDSDDGVGDGVECLRSTGTDASAAMTGSKAASTPDLTPDLTPPPRHPQTTARPGFATEFKNISHKCYLAIIITCLQESDDSKKNGEAY